MSDLLIIVAVVWSTISICIGVYHGAARDSWGLELLER